MYGNGSCKPRARSPDDAAPDGDQNYFASGSTEMPPLTGLNISKKDEFELWPLAGIPRTL
jgi:hypothetical protein